MEVKTNKPEISLTLDNKARLTFTVPKALITEIEELNDDITLIVKNYHSKRTLTQNAYMWSMINKLAVKVNETCENVYKNFIRDYGVRDFLLVKDSSVKDFIERWNKKGIGWFCEEVRKGKVDGTTTLVVYYGSSSYDSKEMSRVMEAIIDECNEQSIPTILLDDFRSLKNEND